MQVYQLAVCSDNNHDGGVVVITTLCKMKHVEEGLFKEINHLKNTVGKWVLLDCLMGFEFVISQLW